jgi:hypothetical protein
MKIMAAHLDQILGIRPGREWRRIEIARLAARILAIRTAGMGRTVPAAEGQGHIHPSDRAQHLVARHHAIDDDVEDLAFLLERPAPSHHGSDITARRCFSKSASPHWRKAPPHELATAWRCRTLSDDQMFAITGPPELSIGIIDPSEEFAETW